MIEVELSNGFIAKIKDNVLKDINTLKMMVSYEKEPTNFELFEKMLSQVFGEEQALKFVQSFTDDEGCIPVDAVFNGYKELMTKGAEKGKELKN